MHLLECENIISFTIVDIDIDNVPDPAAMIKRILQALFYAIDFYIFMNDVTSSKLFLV